jgi:hypothetical protein
MSRTDVINLEKSFIAALENGSLPVETVERVYALLMHEEARIDRGGSDDLRRRARLEDACELWRTGRAGSDVLTRSRPRVAKTPPAGAYSASPLVCPPATQPVDNFVDNSAAETTDDADQAVTAEIDALTRHLAQLRLGESTRRILAAELNRAGSPADRLALLRRQVEQVERADELAAAVKAAGQYRGRAWAAPAPELTGPRFLIVPRRRP